jgi:uncharacterized spore protein YtfJ
MSEYLKSIVDLIKDSATVKTVFGDPVSAHGRTVIPVARIAYGFGGGGGRTRPREGEGGGGGLWGTPLGVVEITADHTKFVPLNYKRKLAAAGLGGLCLGVLLIKSLKHR